MWSKNIHIVEFGVQLNVTAVGKSIPNLAEICFISAVSGKLWMWMWQPDNATDTSGKEWATVSALCMSAWWRFSVFWAALCVYLGFFFLPCIHFNIVIRLPYSIYHLMLVKATFKIHHIRMIFHILQEIIYGQAIYKNMSKKNPNKFIFFVG